MTKLKFTLAELALATHRAHPANDGYQELAQGLMGQPGINGALPARRLTLTEQFNLAVEKACLLPDSEIAAAMAGITPKFPQLWLETVRPGCRLRTGCLFTQNAAVIGGGISMLLVMENSVKEWVEKIGWRVPPQSYKDGDRAIYNRPVHMAFGRGGIEWISGDLERTPAMSAIELRPVAVADRNVGLDDAIAMVAHGERYRGLDAKTRLAAQADMRKTYAAADFMARALVLLHSERLVDPAVYEESEHERQERRREGGALRQAVKTGGRISAPCHDIAYIQPAVARLATAQGPKQVSALYKVVTVPVDASKELQCRKTGEYLLDKNGNRRRNKGYDRQQKVGENYFERQCRVTASRPVELKITKGAPVLTIGPLNGPK